jgi:hypothetical protein
MQIDRRAFLEGLGGSAAIALMSDEAKADALEQHLLSQTNPAPKFPTTAEIEAQIDTQPTRKGVGNLFIARQGNVARLTPLPERPTLADYFKLRFVATSNHCLQSANRAMKNGMSEEIILACLLHDTVQELIKVDHGWWSAQMYEPYVSAKVAFVKVSGHCVAWLCASHSLCGGRSTRRFEPAADFASLSEHNPRVEFVGVWGSVLQRHRAARYGSGRIY